MFVVDALQELAEAEAAAIEGTPMMQRCAELMVKTVAPPVADALSRTVVLLKVTQPVTLSCAPSAATMVADDTRTLPSVTTAAADATLSDAAVVSVRSPLMVSATAGATNTDVPSVKFCAGIVRLDEKTMTPPGSATGVAALSGEATVAGEGIGVFCADDASGVLSASDEGELRDGDGGGSDEAVGQQPRAV